MIYELAILARADLGETGQKNLSTLVESTLKEFNGEVLVDDDWGVKKLAQATSAGTSTGHYLYYIYRADTNANTELTRKFGINEKIMRTMILKLGDDAKKDALVKAYKTPLSKKYRGSVLDQEEEEGADNKERRRFSKRKNCWFAAKNITADWKDPGTYAWLVNEFGKISPARVSNVSRKHQRFANSAIKRARNMALISHLSGRVVE